MDMYHTQKEPEFNRGESLDSGLPGPGAVIEEGVIIIIGPPASGKGTQAGQLASRSGLPHISVGQLLRDEVAGGSERGKLLQEYLDRGELAPDDLVTEVLEERLGQADCSRGFILDGYPRSVPQKELLDDMLARNSFPRPIVIELTLSEEEAIRRALSRNDGRTDDNEETIRHRQRVFHQQTAPVIAEYNQDGGLYQVSSEDTIESVSQEILTRVLEAQDDRNP